MQKILSISPRLQTCKNKEKTNILVEQEKYPNFLEMKDIIHSYMKLKHDQDCNGVENNNYISYILIQ
jgi:hypothetical protein